MNLVLFFTNSPRERVPFSNASRVSRKSSVLRRARNNNNNNTGHASTRASFVVGKSSSRGSARRTKRKSENFSRVREEETEIQTKKVHAYALEETRNRREIQINTREAWKKTKNSSNSSRDTHRTAHTDTHTHRERERERDRQRTERNRMSAINITQVQVLVSDSLLSSIFENLSHLILVQNDWRRGRRRRQRRVTSSRDFGTVYLRCDDKFFISSSANNRTTHNISKTRYNLKFSTSA